MWIKKGIQMIEIKELRYGNYLTSKYETTIVRGNGIDEDVEVIETVQFLGYDPMTQEIITDSGRDHETLEPIEITEEWLLRLGFEKNENGQFKLLKHSEVPILFNEDLNGWTCDGINFSINRTKYVHQLQNLYFALTGEELN